MIYIADLNGEFFNSLLYLNEYYGVTQNPDTKDYIIIMKYYKNLFLYNFSNLIHSIS